MFLQKDLATFTTNEGWSFLISGIWRTIKAGVAVLIQSIHCLNSRVSLCFVNARHRHSRSRLLTHRIGGVTCMINPRWRGNRAKNYKTLQGNQCFSRFKTSRCLESLRINIFWKQLIIAEVLSTICVISAEFLVEISLVKCVVNWSLGQFETFVVQNMHF